MSAWVSEVTQRARRIAALAAFLVTFEQDDRAEVIRRLRDGKLIKEETADLLSEMSA